MLRLTGRGPAGTRHCAHARSRPRAVAWREDRAVKAKMRSGLVPCAARCRPAPTTCSVEQLLVWLVTTAACPPEEAHIRPGPVAAAASSGRAAGPHSCTPKSSVRSRQGRQCFNYSASAPSRSFNSELSSASIRAGVSVRADYLNSRAQRAKRFLKKIDPLHRLLLIRASERFYRHRQTFMP